jgi:recombination protein U
MYSGGRANLGKELETLLDLACQQYFDRGIACIQKVPTPFKIIGKSGNALLAVPEKKSTVDYLGEYQGSPFAMEAKSTENRTRYTIDPWDREVHQRRFLGKWQGLKYYFVSFWSLQEHYLIPFDQYLPWTERKSIPLEWIRQNALQVRNSRGIILDFISAIERRSKDADKRQLSCDRPVQAANVQQ